MDFLKDKEYYFIVNVDNGALNAGKGWNPQIYTRDGAKNVSELMINYTLKHGQVNMVNLLTEP